MKAKLVLLLQQQHTYHDAFVLLLGGAGVFHGLACERPMLGGGLTGLRRTPYTQAQGVLCYHPLRIEKWRLC